MKQWKKFVGYDTWDRSQVGEDSANPGPIDNKSLLAGEGLCVYCCVFVWDRRVCLGAGGHCLFVNLHMYVLCMVTNVAGMSASSCLSAAIFTVLKVPTFYQYLCILALCEL